MHYYFLLAFTSFLDRKRVTPKNPAPGAIILSNATASSLEEMSQRGQAVGNTLSDLIDSRFEPQISRSKDECVSASPTAVGDIGVARRGGRLPPNQNTTNDKKL